MSPSRGHHASIGRLVAWQCMSIILTITGVCSSRLAALGVDAPTAQSAAAYLLLALHWLILPRRSQQAYMQLDGQLPWWQWLAIASADVEGNYLLVKAYQFTDIISVTILDAFTVPCVMILSISCTGVRYGPRQYIGAGLCLAGIATLFASDLWTSDERYPNAWLGNVLVLTGATLYGISNVAQEHIVRRLGNRHEYLAHLGSYGFGVALLQTLALERAAVAAAWQSIVDGSGEHQLELLGFEAAFVVSLVCFYVGVATLLSRGSSATTMNLSLLTSDFWSVTAGVTLLHSCPGPVYAAAFSLVILGLLLYHIDYELACSWQLSIESVCKRLVRGPMHQEVREVLVHTCHEENGEQQQYYCVADDQHDVGNVTDHDGHSLICHGQDRTRPSGEPSVEQQQNRDNALGDTVTMAPA